MRRFLLKTVSLLLAAALLGGLPVCAAADEVPALEAEFALGEASEYGEIAIMDDTAAAVATESAATPSLRRGVLRTGSVPSSYDPRESGGYLPPVRTQAFNTCWAVAAIGAAEADGLTRGLLTTSASETDLSERHLIYFLSHQADDPLGYSSQDYNVSPSFWIQSGGNPVIAAMTMASWHGAADEAATNSPYSGLSTDDSLDGAYAYTDELHLENTYAVDISTESGRTALKTMIREHGSAVLCLYYDAFYLFAGSPAAQGEEPDPVEDPELDGSAEPLDQTAEEEAEPTETPNGPAEESDGSPEAIPAAEPEEPEAPEEVSPELPEELPPEAPEETPAEALADPAPDDSADADLTKEISDPEISSEDGGAFAGLDGAPDTGEDLRTENETADDYTVCYYKDQPTTPSTNHEVLVVGWDDDYPAENFGYSQAGTAPAQNGAWLCRNSHGPSWAGGDGYFWVSYFDASVSASTGSSISSRATVFEFATADNYDNNYEYDGGVVLAQVTGTVNGNSVSLSSANASTRRWYANVFPVSHERGSELLRAVSTYTYRANVSYTVQVYTGLTDPADPTSGTLAAEISGTFPYAGYHTVVLPESVRLWEGRYFSVVFLVGRASDNTLYVPACHTSSQWRCTNETLAGQSFVSTNGESWTDCKTLPNEPNVRIKAFTDDLAAVFPFTDVSESAWYYDDVRTSWSKYLVHGTSADTYEPTVNATRAQVVTVLWRLAGQPVPDDDSSFPDVAADAWYADAIAWGQENGLVEGHTDGLFRPNAAITRQEFITILYRYAQLRGMDISPQTDITGYSDVSSVGLWARQAIRWSFASGIMQGVETDDGSIIIAPLSSVTRAQLAAFLNRFSDISG